MPAEAQHAHFRAPESLGENPFPAGDERREAWEVFSTGVVASLARLISSLDEIWRVTDAARYTDWKNRYAELLPSDTYSLAEVARIRDGDQSQWIFGRFNKIAMVAFGKFLHGRQDAEHAERIVSSLAEALRATVGNNSDFETRVEAWRNSRMPSKATLQRFRRSRKTATSVRTGDAPEESGEWDRNHFLRDDADYSLEPPPFLRGIRKQRLSAICTLWSEAASAVEKELPKTRDQVIYCLKPLIRNYAIVLFDELAKAQLHTLGPRGSPKRFRKWLRLKCLKAVLDDTCEYMSSQFPIAVGHLIGLFGENQAAETWRALWSASSAWNPFSDATCRKSLKKYLTTHLEARSVHWEGMAESPPAPTARAKRSEITDAKFERRFTSSEAEPRKEARQTEQRETAPGKDSSSAYLFRQRGKVWELMFAGQRQFVSHVVGLQYVAELLRSPRTEMEALALTSRSAEQEIKQVISGGLEVTDEKTIRQVQKELDERRSQISALGDNDWVRRGPLEEEIGKLVKYLNEAQRAPGLMRKRGGTVGRARISAANAIQRAIEKIRTVHPELADHLKKSIRTGTLLTYMPEVVPNWEF